MGDHDHGSVAASPAGVDGSADGPLLMQVEGDQLWPVGSVSLTGTTRMLLRFALNRSGRRTAQQALSRQYA